jgi:hypothetical protein
MQESRRRAREAQNYGYFGISFYYVQIGSFHPAYFIVQHQQYNDSASASGSLREPASCEPAASWCQRRHAAR